MLDTVILTIPHNWEHKGFRILDHSRFTPRADLLNRYPTGLMLVKFMNNPTALDKKRGIYRPRMTLMRRPTKNGIETPLKIEFSVPKMLHGNNVNEVQEKDFEAVLGKLHVALREMGVLVHIDELRHAKVMGFHASKNILLLDGYTSSFVIGELRKTNTPARMDVNRDSFRNDGHSLQLYTNSHSLVIYDKVRDLKKPGKRAMDKDQNAVQRSLFYTLKTDGILKTEILRIEARLAKKVKLNALLQKLGYEKNPTFKDIFNAQLCKDVLLDYWQNLLMDQNLFVFDMNSSAMRTLEKLLTHYPDLKPKELVYRVGLWALSKEGIRTARTMLEKRGTSRSWYRIADNLKSLDEISDRDYHGWVKQIDNALRAFEPFRLSTNQISHVKNSKVS